MRWAGSRRLTSIAALHRAPCLTKRLRSITTTMRRHLTPSMALSLVALFVSLSAGAYAAVKLPANSVGAAQIKSSAVRSSEVRDHSLKAADFALGQLPAGPAGATGATGTTGAQGPKGETGATGPIGHDGAGQPNPFAVVAANGTLDRGSHVTSVSHGTPGNGIYVVTFDRNINACAFIGVVGAAAADGSLSGEISTEKPTPVSTNGVEVKTRNSAGAPMDLSFHIALAC